MMISTMTALSWLFLWVLVPAAAPPLPNPSEALRRECKPALADLLVQLKDCLGEDLREVQQVLGEPAAVSATVRGNLHAPSVDDVIWHLEYPAAEVKILATGYGGGGLLEVTVPPGFLAANAFEDSQLTGVIRRLGDPSSVEAGAVLFRCENEVGTDVLRVSHENGEIAAYTVSYFWD